MQPITDTVPWPSDLPCSAEMHSWPHLYTATANGFAQCLTADVAVYLELGTWCGGSALLAAKMLPSAHIICIDAWDGRGGPQYDEGTATRSLELCQANLWEYRHRTTLVQADTLTGIESVHAAGVRPDVIYIDADHNYDAARANISTAIALFPSALICGDDYTQPCGRAADHIAVDRVRVIDRLFWWIEQGH